MLKYYFIEMVAKPAAIHLADPFSVKGLGKIVLFGLTLMLFMQHLKLWGILPLPLDALRDSVMGALCTLLCVAIGMRFRYIVLRSYRQEMQNRRQP